MKNLLLLFAVISIAGCAVNKGTINSYNEPTYEGGTITSIAIFSLRGAQFAPSEARTVNREITRAMASKNPNLEIIPPSEAQRKINSSDFAERWSDFVEDYYTSGLANQEILAQASEVLGVDAIMQGQLLRLYQVDGDGWTQKGTTRVTVSYSILQTSTAKTVWEVSADGVKRNALEFAEAPTVIDSLELAIDKIKVNIPKL